jgi:hypothetical protein
VKRGWTWLYRFVVAGCIVWTSLVWSIPVLLDRGAFRAAHAAYVRDPTPENAAALERERRINRQVEATEKLEESAPAAVALFLAVYLRHRAVSSASLQNSDAPAAG